MKMFSKLLIATFVAATALSSCEKELDQKSFNSVDEEEALGTSGGVEAALIGAYSRVGDDNVLGGGFGVISELLGASDELEWNGTFAGYTQIFNKTIPVNNGFALNTWTESYEAINVTNNVLANMDKVQEGKKGSVEGQAKFLRAAVYFDLVRVYAKAWNDGSPAANDGVPLILTPTGEISDSNKVPRSKVSEVYDQVISDLQDAESLLTIPSSLNFYACRTTASALLARVYLQQGEYKKAAEEANKVLTTGKNSLTASYMDAFPVDYDNSNKVVGNTTEDVFALQVTASSGYNDFNTFFSPLGRGDIEMNEKYFDDYESGDERLNEYYDDGSIYCGKFDMVYGAVHIIRLAEMYLIRAEANFREGTSLGASPVADINVIRTRAGLPALASVNLDQIIRERRHELAFEGHRVHDVKRLQLSIGSIPWNSPKLVLPIPERETKINPSLTQNEGY
ncbi:MAG: RagB/SusD family nutrient uptake outer membrane protein [Flavihumibacter sp.]